ncbi:DUF3558 family protein [Actinomycetospora aeridis]|uniref:DUF3558 family protein n=1 Tax=Actinomycetospora aeridis TaxID=3129231 RepID=A0ABU8N8S2_9PSEU
MKRTAVVLLLLIVMSGCSRSPAPPTPMPDERFGAPNISAPRDVRPFAGDPCAGPLSSGEWDELGFAGSAQRRTLAVGENSCAREGPGRQRYAALIVAGSRDVLVETYRTRLFPIFRSVDVGGLPAVVEQNSEQSVSCTVSVGTAEDQGFVLNYSEYELGPDGRPNDPCGRAQRVAMRIVAALPPLPGK